MADWEDENTRIEDRTVVFFAKGLATLWYLLHDERINMVKVMVSTLMLSVCYLVTPYTLKIVFDELPSVLQTQTITHWVIIALVAQFVLSVGSLFFRQFVRERIFLKCAIRLENLWPVLAQNQLLRLSLSFHNRENIGRKISKINKGCEKLIEILVDLSWGFCPQFFYLVINMLFLLIIDFRLAVVFFAPICIAFWLNLKISNKFAPCWAKWEKKKEIASGIFCQSLLNVRTVQLFVQEDRERNNLQKLREEMVDIDIGASIGITNHLTVVGFVLNMAFFLAVVVGIYFIYSGTATIGTLVYVISTGGMTTGSIWELTSIYSRLLRNMVVVQRMKELFDEIPDIVNATDAYIPNDSPGELRFEGVSFTYPEKEQPVLDGFDLVIKPGEMVALVGKSGEGKTTVIQLASRMYDITKGTISLDGHDIRRLDLYWYRSQFAIVAQDVEVFDLTLRENVAYPYPNATDSEVRQAIEAAHLTDLVVDNNRMPNGLDTFVGERGVRLSGGEKQRVGIARAYLALLRGARILILDEATSSLDSEAERAIQEMIDQLRVKMKISIIAIAHRLSTISKADDINVIQNGKIVERGDHERLMEKNGLYSRLVELQKLGDVRD